MWYGRCGEVEWEADGGWAREAQWHYTGNIWMSTLIDMTSWHNKDMAETLGIVAAETDRDSVKRKAFWGLMPPPPSSVEFKLQILYHCKVPHIWVSIHLSLAIHIPAYPEKLSSRLLDMHGLHQLIQMCCYKTGIWTILVVLWSVVRS